MREEKQLEHIEKRHKERLDKINLLTSLSPEDKEKWMKTSKEYLDLERRITHSRTKQTIQMYMAETKEEREQALNNRQTRQKIDFAERERSNELREQFELLFKPLDGPDL